MMRLSTRPISLLAASGVLAIVAAACSASSTGGSAPASAQAPTAAPSAAASAEGSGAAGEVYEVKVATGAMGSYITGEDGKTLYVFTADSPNKSTCADTCAANWPAFTLDDGETVKAGDGVTGALTTFARADGKMQVAINGLPLYYFGKDTKAGDTGGQGIGGKWFAASPSGAAPSPSSGSSY